MPGSTDRRRAGDTRPGRRGSPGREPVSAPRPPIFSALGATETLLALLPALLLAGLPSAPAAAVSRAPHQEEEAFHRDAVSTGARQPGPRELDLRSFLTRVLERSPEAEAAALRREAAGHAAAARQRPLNPALEAEGPDSEGVAQLQLRQPLRLFGQGDALERLGRAERTLAERRLTAEHASVAREAAGDWVDAAADGRRVALLEETVRLRREAVERARAALRRGWGSRSSVQSLRLEARAAERELETARGELARDRRELRRLLGRPGDEPLEVEGALAGDPDRPTLVPVPRELPADAPEVTLARAGTAVAAAELARSRTRARPVPAVGPMVSVGKGVDPGVSLELSLPLWSRNREGVEAARARLDASRAAARATRRTTEAAYGRLVDRRDALSDQLARLRSRELEPARRELRRWTASRDLGLPVADGRRRARTRLLEVRREELELQRRITRLEVEAAWRSGSLLAWLRGTEADTAAGPSAASRP